MITEQKQVEVRYCEDCKYYTKGLHSDMCSNPLVNAENLVRRKAASAHCNVARRDFGSGTTCGPGGKYWQYAERIKVPVAEVEPRNFVHLLFGWLKS